MADKRKTPELLAPAGDMERLKMAVLYGADAVYLAGTSFGMRALSLIHILKSCRDAAREIVRDCGWTVIRCARDDEPRTVEDIHDEVYRTVRALL